MTSMQRFLVLLPASLVVVFFLSFVINFKNENGVTAPMATADLSAQESITETTTVPIPQNDKNNNEAIANPIPEVRLVITESRCRGCGKCAIIDSEHFEISGRIATVISQSNLSSTKLASAITNCPDDAISLN